MRESRLEDAWTELQELDTMCKLAILCDNGPLFGRGLHERESGEMQHERQDVVQIRLATLIDPNRIERLRERSEASVVGLVCSGTVKAQAAEMI